MKIKSICSLFYLAFMLLALGGCKEDEAALGEPFSKVEGLIATDWVMAEVYLVDEGNPAKPERNISQQVITTDQPLTLSFESEGNFTAGTENNFFPLTGAWSFDDPNAPRKIILISPDGTVTDAPLGGPIRISDSQLKINFVKRSCPDGAEEKAVLGYRLVFNRK